MKVFTGFKNVNELLHLFILGQIFGFIKSNKYFRIFSKSIQYLSFFRYLPIFIWQNILAVTNNILLHYIRQWNTMILCDKHKQRYALTLVKYIVAFTGFVNVFLYLHSKLHLMSGILVSIVPLCLQHNFSVCPWVYVLTLLYWPLWNVFWYTFSSAKLSTLVQNIWIW